MRYLLAIFAAALTGCTSTAPYRATEPSLFPMGSSELEAFVYRIPS